MRVKGVKDFLRVVLFSKNNLDDCEVIFKNSVKFEKHIFFGLGFSKVCPQVADFCVKKNIRFEKPIPRFSFSFAWQANEGIGFVDSIEAARDLCANLTEPQSKEDMLLE